MRSSIKQSRNKARPKFVTVNGKKKEVYITDYAKDLYLFNRGLMSKSEMKLKYGSYPRKRAA